LVNGLYRLRIPRVETETAVPAFEEVGDGERTVTLDELHRVLGHVSPRVAHTMVAKGMVEGVTVEPSGEPLHCESCEAGKMTRKPISKERVRPRATEIGGEVHSDVWGPAPTQSLGGRRYASMFTD
ncbi:hypothetical protein K466DRAFT_471493, partial [Polyporus arcularius HHB13444]